MIQLKINNVRISLLHECSLEQAVCKKLGLSAAALGRVKLLRKAVDARKKNEICLNHHVLIEVDVNKSSRLAKRLLADRDVALYEQPRQEGFSPGTLPLAAPPVVIGAGPAGLLAALQLAQQGYQPLLLERGKPVAQRVTDVDRFWRTGSFDPASNVQFGEGGAGTFSDGKLTTRVNDPVMAEILQLFVDAGAPENILWEHKPHVGTDKLRAMVTGLSKRICELGGSIRYNAHVTDLLTEGSTVQGVVLASGERIAAGAVVLACGHSARDTFSMLQEMKIPMEPKAFSIGARIEHRQAWLDRAQYGAAAGHPALGAADYHLAVHLPNGRGVYSFCMCPGGTVVAAASEENTVVTNGMSCFARDGENCNAALLVGVEPADFGVPGPLGGVEFQRKWEKAAYALSGSYAAPVQRVEDFLQGRKSTRWGEVTPTYRPGAVPENLNRCLPEFVTESMRQGIRLLDGKLHGFAMGDALLTGVETRSSSPVRILRDDSLQCPTLRGLYPCGEGAGYAGGIVSAAVDGIRCAEQILLDSARKK